VFVFCGFAAVKR